MRALGGILLFVSLLAVAFGALSLSNATLGVGGIAVGCFLAILARIFQASAYQADLLKVLAPPSTPSAAKPADDLGPLTPLPKD